MSTEVTISDDFNSFLLENSEQIDKVKKEEARMANVPLPINETGTCIAVKAAANKTKSKVVNGVTEPGKAVINMQFRVLESSSGEFGGKLVQRSWWLSQTANSTPADAFKRMLDEMENTMGLPRKIRVDGQLNDILNYFLKGGEGGNAPSLPFIVRENAKNTMDDGKDFRFTVTKEGLEANDSIIPGVIAKDTPVVTEQPSKKKVTFQDSEWFVLKEYDTKVELALCDDESIQKIVPKADVQGL